MPYHNKNLYLQFQTRRFQKGVRFNFYDSFPVSPEIYLIEVIFDV